MTGEFVVRWVDDAIIERLRKRAEVHHRSLEAELRDIIEQATRQVDEKTALKLTDKIRRKLQGPFHSDRGKLIREDRDR